jgi:hypothetical protein
MKRTGPVLDRLRLAGCVLVAAALLAVPVYAQTATSGGLKVVVTDSDGAVLPGATVSAAAPDAITRRTAITGEDGAVTLPALDPSERYVVTVTLDGFNNARSENVLVKAGQTHTVRVELQLGTVTETLTVVAESPVVDQTSAITGQDITLALTEALPTGRTYQSFLQQVPGVLPSSTGNPAARSGINYVTVGGVVGQSSDNVYYIEGINVTDRTTGTFGANLNTEIIQEQSVLTGGLPAEFQGAPGLVSSVVTKSGGNEFRGSASYYHQDSSLVADNKNTPDAEFSAYDTAATLGGPIIRDRAWFFGSYRLLNKEEDITGSAGNFLRAVTTDQEQGFGKLSWNITDKDLFSGTYLTDPFERDGSTEFTTLNNRSVAREQGGDRVGLRYTRLFGNNFIAEGSYSEHYGEVSNLSAVRDPRNNVAFRRSDFPGSTPPAALVQLGGAGVDTISERSNDAGTISADWGLDTDFGSHTVKAGYSRISTEYYEDARIPGGARYDSLSNRYVGAGVTAAQVAAAGAFTAVFFNVNNTSDLFGPVGLINSINNSPNRAALYSFFDADGNGSLTAAEIGSRLVFNSTAGNPQGQINYYRIREESAAPYDVGSEGDVVFLQDTWQWNRFAVNAGVRAERTDALDSDGNVLFEFDWEYAPRVSVAYDLRGDGRHRLTAYYGRYYDPIKDSMNDFAGGFSGPVLNEEVFVNGEWLTFRIRGGRAIPDAVYAPTTKVPYTDEYMVGYKVDLGSNMSVETLYSRRETRDVFEDFDLCLYAGSCYPGDPNAPGTLFLGLDHFGYSASSPPVSNFVLGTLAGGERNYDIIEAVFRKRLANNWQMIASYTHTDAEGNVDSDSNADFVGDDIQYDPRAPNMFGPLNGSIEHVAKVSGSYLFDFGLQVGGSYFWNSGASLARADVIANRYLPATGATFDFNGTTYPWTDPNAIGAITTDSYGTLDLRVAYDWNINSRFGADFYLDVFNVLDDQATIMVEAAGAGRGGVAFGGGKEFVEPRRFFLGTRLRF